MLIVSFYTPDYAEHAERLRASCDRFGYPHVIEAVPQVSRWEHACAMKASFMRDWWPSAIGFQGSLWLDADAEVLRPLDLFDGLDANFAVYKQGGGLKTRFRSGTVWMRAPGQAYLLLDRWAKRCDDDPDTWDQEHLFRAWESMDADEDCDLHTHWLPLSYCQRFDEADGVPDPHIVHYQASRQLKDKGRKAPT